VKLVELLKNKKGIADVFAGVVIGAVLFILFYMMLCYLGYVQEKHIEPAVNISNPYLSDAYNTVKQGYVDFLKVIPAIFILSFILLAVYRHFVETSRGRKIR